MHSLKYIPGVEGLVHVSEITWANTPINAKEFFKLGDEYEAKVVTLSKEDRKMSLSIKQMTEDPWNTIETQYPEGSKHKGLVKNITPYGVFVELSPGIGGMIHISDLSWLKRFNNPNEYTKVGDEIDVIIMSIDKENRKLQLDINKLKKIHGILWKKLSLLEAFMKELLPGKMIKALLFSFLMAWKDLHARHEIAGSGRDIAVYRSAPQTRLSRIRSGGNRAEIHRRP